MAAMNARRVLWACVLGSIVPAGCDGNRGYLVTPVSLDQRLKETVVLADPGWYSAKVALVEVEGLIANQRMGWFGGGENPVSLLLEKLDKARRDKAVKAVVLRINSPGGTVQASEAMHHMLAEFRRKSGKPVVACITSAGASGAYYLACAADRIRCQPGGVTGSIGVIIQTVSFAGTMKLLGISADAITSGALKDMGSPLKDLTAEERKVFQQIVDEFYGQFVEVVAKGRKLQEAKVRQLADGRIYTGRQALKLGLVDELGYLPDAVDDAKRAAGIRRAKVVAYDRPPGYRANVYAAAPAAGAGGLQVNLLNVQGGEMMFLRRVKFLYLWTTDLPAAR